MSRLSLILTAGLWTIPIISPHAAPVNVTSISPVAHTVSASATDDIVVNFDQAVDPSTVIGASFRIFGRWSGPASGSISLENSDSRVRFVPDEPFFAGEYVTVALSKAIKNTNGDPLTYGYSWSFWIATDPGTLDLIEVDRIEVRQPGEGGLRCYGAYAGDLNHDGYSDLSVINEDAENVRLYYNDGNGGFILGPTYDLPPGSRPSPNEGADFNNDGEIDLAIGSTGDDKVRVLLGNGAGGFLPYTSFDAAQKVRGLAILDLDADGYDDIASANFDGDNITLLLNNGDGTFAAPNSMETSGQGEWTCAAADANNDGIMDLFVGARTSQTLILLLGDGNGGLTFSASTYAGGYPWMLAVGDVDGDGNVDVAIANSFFDNAGIIRTDGAGGLLPVVTYPTGAFTLAIDLGDIDGDGDLDLVASNYSGNSFNLYENDGTGSFGNLRTFPASAAGSCCILHDRDNDGDLDMIGIDEEDDLLIIYTNTCCFNRGNVNGITGIGVPVDIVDVIYLVSYLFRNGPDPYCLEEANVDDLDSMGTPINILDVIFLVAYLFQDGPSPPACH